MLSIPAFLRNCLLTVHLAAIIVEMNEEPKYNVCVPETLAPQDDL